MANEHKDNTGVTNDVHAGVIAVMASLGTLYKEAENKFDKYTYASIDAFIAFVRDHCWQAGLYIEQDEIDARLVDVCKKDGKPMAMWWAQYAFTIRHVGGTSIGPFRRSVMVQANGAQASGSSQSYALKQFMRSMFLIPVADNDDPDKVATEISAERGANETDLQRRAGGIRRQFLKSETLEELKQAWSANAVDLDHIKRVSETASEFLLKEYETRRLALEARETSVDDKTPPFIHEQADRVLAG